MRAIVKLGYSEDVFDIEHILAVAQLDDGVGFRDPRQVTLVFGVDDALLAASQVRQQDVTVTTVLGLKNKDIGAG